MKNNHLIIDLEKCQNCNNCFLACKDEFVDNDFLPLSAAQPRHGHRWMQIKKKERGWDSLIEVAFLPMPCQHCSNPACMENCNDGAIYKRSDGIVIIDPEKAKGRRELIDACPYGAINWNEESQLPQKCTLCAHLLDDGWKEPRCVQACPTGALSFIRAEPSEMKSKIGTESLETLYPGHNTSPSVYYRNLYRFFDCFVSGSLAYSHDGIVDCAKDAEVILFKDGVEIDRTKTNIFGDFKFDRLKTDASLFEIECRLRNYEAWRQSIELRESVYLKDIILDEAKVT